ncbi:MAG: hypothetical protein WBM74_11155 [Polyangiales bacterium]
MRRLETGAGRLAKLALAAYATVLAAAVAVVLLRSPHPITPAYEATAGCSPRDLAHYCRGVRARVSSYHVFANHQPIYAIDGRGSRDLLEKWVSGPQDRAPWIELLFPEPVDFSSVRLTHAGQVEPAEYTMRSYRLSCSDGDEPRATSRVEGNEASRAEHALTCLQVDRLRIELDIEPGTGRDVVRLYEIEVVP